MFLHTRRPQALRNTDELVETDLRGGGVDVEVAEYRAHIVFFRDACSVWHKTCLSLGNVWAILFRAPCGV